MKAKASITRNVRRYKVTTKIKIGAHIWIGEFIVQASTPKEAQKIGREIVNQDMERVNSIGYKIISDSAVLIGIYARQSGIKTSTEWMEYGNHPEDISVRPDITYKQTGEFKGWKHFLNTGKRVSQYTVKDHQRSNTIVGFLHDGYQPNNIYYIGTFKSPEAAKEFACQHSMSVVQLVDCQDRNGCLNTINKFAFAHGDGFYRVANIGELMFELSV